MTLRAAERQTGVHFGRTVGKSVEGKDTENFEENATVTFIGVATTW